MHTKTSTNHPTKSLPLYFALHILNLSSGTNQPETLRFVVLLTYLSTGLHWTIMHAIMIIDPVDRQTYVSTIRLLAELAPDTVEPIEVFFAVDFVCYFVWAASADLGVEGTHFWRLVVFSLVCSWGMGLLDEIAVVLQCGSIRCQWRRWEVERNGRRYFVPCKLWQCICGSDELELCK